jgi:hypothetical protein
LTTRDSDWETHAARIKAERAERLRQLSGYEEVVAKVSAALFASDPIGINSEDNTDEYDPEAQTIVIRLMGETGKPDVVTIVHEEFTRWFGSGTAGPRREYEGIGQEISRLWSEHQGRPTPRDQS